MDIPPKEDGARLARTQAAVLAARKYREVEPGLVRAIAAAELTKGRSVRDAVKATKSRLHRSAAVYLRRSPDYGAALGQLRSAVESGGRGAVRPLLRRLMAAHASTHERLPLLDAFYTQIFGKLPAVRSVLDVACGLHPLARPWMPLPAQASYTAWEIFADQVDFLNRFFGVMGYAGRAVQRNALEEGPAPAADIAFLLKTLPCLEQIESGCGRRLLHRIDAPVLVVSFPTHSLSKRRKGMEEQYAAYFAALIAGTKWRVEPLTFPSEQVYVVHKS